MDLWMWRGCAEKLAAKADEGESNAGRVGALGGLLGAMVVPAPLARYAMKDMKADPAANERLIALAKKMDPTLKTEITDSIGGAHYHPIDHAARVRTGDSPAFLAHELGHGTGWRPSMGRAAIGNIALQAGVLAAPLGAVSSLLHARGKSDQERADAYRDAQKRVGATGALLSAPVLGEEARATYRAFKHFMPKGQGAAYARRLLPAYGTYLAVGALPTLGSVAGLEVARRKALTKVREAAPTPVADR